MHSARDSVGTGVTEVLLHKMPGHIHETQLSSLEETENRFSVVHVDFGEPMPSRLECISYSLVTEMIFSALFDDAQEHTAKRSFETPTDIMPGPSAAQ